MQAHYLVYSKVAKGKKLAGKKGTFNVWRNMPHIPEDYEA